MKKKTPIKTNQKNLIVLLSAILIAGLSFLFLKNGNYTAKEISTNTETYINNKYGFEIIFPDDYVAYEDSDNLSGWPNAIVLIHNGGQSYDLPIEIWDKESDYKMKYPVSRYDTKAFNTKDNKFITLTNLNNDADVAKIIASFKFKN